MSTRELTLDAVQDIGYGRARMLAAVVEEFFLAPTYEADRPNEVAGGEFVAKVCGEISRELDIYNRPHGEADRLVRTVASQAIALQALAAVLFLHHGSVTPKAALPPADEVVGAILDISGDMVQALRPSAEPELAEVEA